MIREQFPAITLATHGTLNVERFLGWSPDIFRGPRGGAFINNNPGASIVGAVPLLIARPLLATVERWNDRLDSSIARSAKASRFSARAAVQARREWYILTIAFLTAAGLMAPVSAVTITAVGRTLSVAGVPLREAIAVALTLGFGTPIFVRTGYLNHNLLVCHAGLWAALVLWNNGAGRLTAARAAVAGALGGFAVLCDYSGVITLAAAAIYAWMLVDRSEGVRGRFRAGAWFAAGALPMLLALFAYQRWAFGSPALPSQHFMPAIEPTARGYRGMDWPSIELMAMNFFNPGFGLFAVCPLLGLGLAAPFVKPDPFRLPRREMWLALTFFGAFTLFCSANQYSRLQWTTGIRYLVPTVPGLLLLSLQVLQVMPVAVRYVVIAASVLLAWVPAVTHAPWSALAGNLNQFQLSWIRRMAEYDAVSRPTLATAVVLGLTACTAALIWTRDRGAR